MTEPEKKPEPPTAAELRDATVWRILRAAYLRLLAPALGRRPIDLTDAEANGLIDPWLDAMRRDHAMLVECMAQAKAEGAGEVNAKLHGAAVQMFDAHELLDQVLEPAMPEDGIGMASPRHADPQLIEDGDADG